MRFVEHVQTQTVECTALAEEAARAGTRQDSALTLRLVVAGAPVFTIVSGYLLALLAIGAGHQIAGVSWVLGGIAGVLAFIVAQVHFRKAHRIAEILSKLPTAIRLTVQGTLGLGLMFGPVVIAAVLWWTGHLILLINISFAASLAAVISGSGMWLWLWRRGLYNSVDESTPNR